jgi:ribonuclease BN (tRNA processing enzyme)
MRLKVLGSSGAEFPGYNPPAFLIDGVMLLDAGTIGSRLSESEQWDIRNILITHSHLDHIKGIPFLADNIIIKNMEHSFTIFGIKETLASLRENLLNDKIWPDFTKISAAIEPVIKLRDIYAGRTFSLDSYKITAYKVNHTVPAAGYIIRDHKGRGLLYTGDTGPTDKIWKASDRVNMAIVEVSFPNSMEELAIKTGHLTSGLLKVELNKIKEMPDRIYITHPKPQYINQIRKEIKLMKNGKIDMLKEGRVYEI